MPSAKEVFSQVADELARSGIEKEVKPLQGPLANLWETAQDVLNSGKDDQVGEALERQFQEGAERLKRKRETLRDFKYYLEDILKSQGLGDIPLNIVVLDPVASSLGPSPFLAGVNGTGEKSSPLIIPEAAVIVGDRSGDGQPEGSNGIDVASKDGQPEDWVREALAEDGPLVFRGKEVPLHLRSSRSREEYLKEMRLLVQTSLERPLLRSVFARTIYPWEPLDKAKKKLSLDLNNLQLNHLGKEGLVVINPISVSDQRTGKEARYYLDYEQGVEAFATVKANGPAVVDDLATVEQVGLAKGVPIDQPIPARDPRSGELLLTREAEGSGAEREFAGEISIGDQEVGLLIRLDSAPPAEDGAQSDETGKSVEYQKGEFTLTVHEVCVLAEALVARDKRWILNGHGVRVETNELTEIGRIAERLGEERGKMGRNARDIKSVIPGLREKLRHFPANRDAFSQQNRGDATTVLEIIGRMNTGSFLFAIEKLLPSPTHERNNGNPNNAGRYQPLGLHAPRREGWHGSGPR